MENLTEEDVNTIVTIIILVSEAIEVEGLEAQEIISEDFLVLLEAEILTSGLKKSSATKELGERKLS